MRIKKEKRMQVNWRIAVSGILCAVLLAVMIAAQLLSHVDQDTLSAQARAGAAARQVAAQFDQAIEDGFRQLKVGSAAVNGGNACTTTMLSSLTENGSFKRAALVRGGLQQEADGSELPAERVPDSFIAYSMGDARGKIIAGPDGVIQLRLPAGTDAELVGWLDADYIGSILGGAYPQAYDYYLYNAATGAYIINTGDFEEQRYYDTLLALNEGGRTSRLMISKEGQAYINLPDGDSYYIAQQATGIEPWSISLFMSWDIFESLAQPGCIPAWVSIALVLLFLASLAVFIILLAKRNAGKRRRTKVREQVRESMLQRAVDSAQMAFFVYNRKDERIVDRFDGLRLLDAGESERIESVSALTKACGLDETDGDRLYDRIRELKADEAAELRISCSVQDGERMLRFKLQCMQEDGNYVIVSIRDCTLESERENTVKAEESFRRAMQGKASSVWEIDAARNRWRLVSGKIPKGLLALGVNTREWRNYTVDLNGPMREFMDAGDYDKYADVMSPSGLNGLLREGKGQMSLECRVHAGNDAYEWYRLELRIFRSAERGDLMANLFVYNVDAAKNADLERQARARVLQQTLTALGGIYDGLYYVDLEKNICYTAKTFGSGIASQLSREFKGTFDAYIDQHVHPEDQAEMRALLSAYQIRKRMTESSHLVRREYRRRHGDQYQDAAIILQAARFENGTVRDVVIAMRKYAGETREM